jgi:uncharacterized membrane protein YeaQ/YmgE (transglycosylase-associated protein family)
MHEVIFWLIVGLLAGALAKAVVRGEGPGGWIGDIVIGLAGALIGGFLFQTFLHHSYGGWIGSTIVAFMGAVALLLIMRAIHGRQPMLGRR